MKINFTKDKNAVTSGVNFIFSAKFSKYYFNLTARKRRKVFASLSIRKYPLLEFYDEIPNFILINLVSLLFVLMASY